MVRFHDLNIKRIGQVVDQKKILKLSYKLGYEVVAVTDYVEDVSMINDLPPPWKKIDLGPGTSELQQLSRITVALKSTSSLYALNKGKLKEYDILAVQPTSLETLQSAANNPNVDVISFDMTRAISYLMRHTHLKTAIDNGKFLEIYYGPALKDVLTRRECFTNAIALCQMDRGKSIIVTSMAQAVADLRGPYDIANLGLLFGLNEGQGKQAITSNCRALLMKAATRRTTVKSSLSVQNVRDISEKDRWKIQGDGDRKRPTAEEEKKGGRKAKKKRLR